MPRERRRSRASISGPVSVYRGKLRERPVVITLTPEGHAALAEGMRRTGMSKPDYIESLIRKDNPATTTTTTTA